MHSKTLTPQEVGEGRAPYNGIISPAALVHPSGKGWWPDVTPLVAGTKEEAAYVP